MSSYTKGKTMKNKNSLNKIALITIFSISMSFINKNISPDTLIQLSTCTWGALLIFKMINSLIENKVN